MTVSQSLSIISYGPVVGPWGEYRGQKPGRELGRGCNSKALSETCTLDKRGIVGIYHKVSKKYLRYVAEFQFRYNNRDNFDISVPQSEVFR
jgi:ISXO2-like transposase domain